MVRGSLALAGPVVFLVDPSGPTPNSDDRPGDPARDPPRDPPGDPAGPGPIDADPTAERDPAARRFPLLLLASIAAHAGLTWALDAVPVTIGEALVLRWLRALAEHPIRGPLGLALGATAVLHLAAAALNRVKRLERA